MLDFLGQRWLLTHGDALCLGDRDYLTFRAQVRTLDWQRDFLARPLAERKAVAQSLRAQSEARNGSGLPDTDVDALAAAAWLDAADAAVMIHGHTHRPADHALAGDRRRVVLSDWDAAAVVPRMQVLRLSQVGALRIALT